METAAKPPLPIPDELTAFFWEGVRARKLMILRCRSCGHFIHYPRPVCEKCRSEDLAPERVSGRATLYSFTITMKPWHPYWIDKVPYVLATVELSEQKGLKMLTNLVECPHDAIKVDMPVEVVFREVSEALTLPFFRPAGVWRDA
ncbi:MAG: OB-fold domain-containing protein [Gammaproteobacteria bacterium]|nr:OB-fold domain-containing protein [Gammaproteobacteria bacterium]